jgi:hypothetical protein
MKVFWRGMITGAGIMLALVLVIAVFRSFQNRDRQIYEYMEQQNEIQELREDYGNRDPYEFLDNPGVRGAADNANAEFQRRREEAIQRIRGRYVD